MCVSRKRGGGEGSGRGEGERGATGVGDKVIISNQPPTNSAEPNGRTSRLGRENATATLGQTPRPQWLPYQGRPFTINQQRRTND
ncbi:MAG: hypothetical protein ACHBN1_25910 [Heteroscytonema crispum UTEX LB 1556]